MKNLPLFIFVLALMAGCIKDDIVFDAVEPELSILICPDTIALDSSFQVEARYLNSVGAEEMVDLNWESADSGILSVDQNGLIRAHQYGESILTATYQAGSVFLSDSRHIVVGDTTVILSLQRSGSIQSTSSYTLKGDFMAMESDGNLTITFSENYEASTSLPGLYVYLSNNPNVVTDGYEIGAVEVFSGEHSYSIPDIGINTYRYLVYFCKPFNVKVGDGEFQ